VTDRPVFRMGLLFVVALIAIQAPRDAQAPDTVARALLRLEDEWAVALTRRDVGVFQRLLAEGRDAVLHDVAAGPDTVTTAHNEDMRVHQFRSTAIVTGWLVVSGRGAQGPFTRRYRFTDTWVRQGGRWQIVGAHDYLAPAR